MKTEIVINHHKAETMYISHPTASYAIFCWNSLGDLFVNSDYGFFGYAWRSFGDDFGVFLATCNADYIVGKFGINYREVTNGKSMPKHREVNLTILVEEFIKNLKNTA